MQTAMHTIVQFFHDHNKSIQDIEKEAFAPRALLIKKLCDNYRKDPEEGDTIIAGDITGKGGNISFYTMESLSSRSDKDECRNHFKANTSRSVLIEPVDYPEIEPYNRQAPYYTGLAYSKYEVPIKTEIFTIYTQIGEYRTNLYTSFDEYHYNNFWLSVTFGLAIKQENISKFLEELSIILNIFGYSPEVMQEIISFEEKTRTPYQNNSK